jgi:hypothetical protein
MQHLKQLVFLVFILLTIVNVEGEELENSFSRKNDELELGAHSNLADSYSDILSFYEQDADLNFAEQNYETALVRYQAVIDHLKEAQISNPSKLLKAICGSMFCYDLLNQETFARRVFDELVDEVALLGNEIEEIVWFRKCPIYDSYMAHQLSLQLAAIPQDTPEENCQFQCNGYALAAAFACGKIAYPPIQVGCYGCLFALEQLCIRCCKGAGFWENCVKPLRRIFYDPEHYQNPAPHPYE